VGVVRAVPRLCICFTTEEQSRTNLSHGSRKVPTSTALGKVHCVDLAIILRAATSGLLTSATHSLRFRLQRSSSYVPRCRTKGFPTSANFESKLSVMALMWSVKN
jgi:hypothetical protein